MLNVALFLLDFGVPSKVKEAIVRLELLTIMTSFDTMPLVPRWICSLTFFIFPTNAGLTVGEEVEAVNSFMSRAALTTKYMTKSGESLGLINVIVKYVQYFKWTC